MIIAMKKPILAAVLNLIPGLGYLYADVRKVFAWILLVSFAADVFSVILAQGESSTCVSQVTPSSIASAISYLLIQAGLVVDVYLEAKKKIKK